MIEIMEYDGVKVAESNNGRTKLYQNEAKGTSVVIYNGVRCDAEDYIARRTQNIPYDEFWMPDKIVAKSKLSDGDVWDAKVGAKNAYRKADEKHHRALKTVLRSRIDDWIRRCSAISPEITREILEKRKDEIWQKKK